MVTKVERYSKLRMLGYKYHGEYRSKMGADIAIKKLRLKNFLVKVVKAFNVSVGKYNYSVFKKRRRKK